MIRFLMTYRGRSVGRTVVALVTLGLLAIATADGSHAPVAYLGFDRNQYPGDNALSVLRKTFRFTGYWLNNPPGESSNTWTGRRAVLRSHGFGFLVLYNGRTYDQLKAADDAALLGTNDAAAAIRTAIAEGFPRRTVIFLDQEQVLECLSGKRAEKR